MNDRETEAYWLKRLRAAQDRARIYTGGVRIISDAEIREVSFMPYVNEAYGVFPIEVDRPDDQE